METILELNNLTKSFGKRRIIDGISLKINSGEVVGFLGPNGSGKTTTIKLITGLLFPDSGDVKICGYDLKSNFEEAVANLGAIVENPDMYKQFSGRRNLEMAARIHGGISGSRIEEVIDIVGLRARIDDKVKKYSLGMKQRLGVALAILNKPRLLIFDEPTNGLDPKGIKEFREIVKNAAHKDGAAVFVSSHMMSEMQLMCDRVAIVEHGRLIGMEDVAAVVDGAESTYYKIIVSDAVAAENIINVDFGNVIKEVSGSPIANGSAASITFAVTVDGVPGLVRRLTESGVGIYAVQPVGSSLEDAFINITGGSGIE